MTHAYAYDHFEKALLEEDQHFTAGPKPGERFPDFRLATTHGTDFRSADHIGKRPLFVYFGSVT